MSDDLAELVLGQAVVERPLQVTHQLLFAAEGDLCCTSVQATIALRETRAFPDFAEQYSFTEVDETRNDITDLLAGRRWLRLRHGFLLCNAVCAARSLARGGAAPAIIS